MEQIKNIIEEYLDEKFISNIIIDDYINIDLSRKHKSIITELNMNFNDPYTLTNFILKPHLIKSYTDKGIIYEISDYY